ncbi:MAG: class I SAM-dependent methyltransferase [bacterium]|nr:class I SAM-dependent methyltransferase [bacterium]MBU1918844.1 class I SAM-dependent methyltransferase [bacterium]
MKNTSDMFNKSFNKTESETWNDFLKYQVSLFLESELRILKEFGLSNQSSPILDLGCGCGYYSIALANALPEAQFVCAEVNDEFIKNCKKNLADHHLNNFPVVKWSAGDQEMPELARNCNTVVLRMVLQHTLQPTKILQDLKEGLKSGTNIYVIEDDLSFYNIHPPIGAFDAFIKVVHDYCGMQKSNVYIGKQVPHIGHEAGLKVCNYTLLEQNNHQLGSKQLMRFFTEALLLFANTFPDIVSKEKAIEHCKELDEYVQHYDKGCCFSHYVTVTHLKT